MHACQRCDGIAGIQVRGDPCRGQEIEVDHAATDGVLGRVLWRRHVADVGEALRAEQVAGDVERRKADGGIMGQSDRGRFRRPLVGERPPRAQDASGAGRGQGGEKIAARLHDMHAKSPVRSPASISNRVASASGLTAGATAARIESVIRLSLQQHAMFSGLRKARDCPRIGL